MVSFPRNPALVQCNWAIWAQFGPKFCNRILQAIMSYDILSKNFEKLLYDGIQYLDQSNVGQFTQKIPSM